MLRREFLCSLGAAATAAAAGTASLAEARGSAADERLFAAGLSLSTGPAGRCDDARIGGPVVRWDPAIGQWRMWYYCRDTSFPAGLAPAFGSGSLATAVSQDGVRWTRVDGPAARGAILAPAQSRDDFDSVHLATGDVIRHDDEWLMCYHGGNHETPRGEDTDAEYRFEGYVLRIGLARSRDGVHWTRIRGSATGGAILEVPEGDVYAGFPNFIHDGRRFILYYTTVDRGGRWYRTRVGDLDRPPDLDRGRRSGVAARSSALRRRRRDHARRTAQSAFAAGRAGSWCTRPRTGAPRPARGAPSRSRFRTTRSPGAASTTSPCSISAATAPGTVRHREPAARGHAARPAPLLLRLVRFKSHLGTSGRAASAARSRRGAICPACGASGPDDRSSTVA
jgi:hypothetical protein